MILSEKIIMLRKKYGWSQEELAERLKQAGYKVTQATVSRKWKNML